MYTESTSIFQWVLCREKTRKIMPRFCPRKVSSCDRSKGDNLIHEWSSWFSMCTSGESQVSLFMRFSRVVFTIKLVPSLIHDRHLTRDDLLRFYISASGEKHDSQRKGGSQVAWCLFNGSGHYFLNCDMPRISTWPWIRILLHMGHRLSFFCISLRWFSPCLRCK